MTIENIGLFKGITAKMSFMDARQTQIAHNVANGDTPGYIPQDLKPVDFSTALGRSKHYSQNKLSSISPSITHERHMPKADAADDPKQRDQRETYEIAPAGNAVIIEEQMLKAGQTAMDYSLMTALYQKSVGMVRTALGNGG